ncbi:MAG: exopolysaccharide biosynthesis protein, partial [Clostridia bacterium]|nr:exopolysaccharide biosynthesis protein [Clostridia bacterium]
MDYDFFQGRFYGRVSEIIFNVWLTQQIKDGVIKKRQIAELPCVYTEKINWWKKGAAFLSAKLFHKKYKGSF